MNISQVLTKLKALIYSKSETDSLLGGKANSSHTHTKSQITDFPSYGNTAGTICQGNDARLSDARTPTSHTHTKSQITDFPSLATVATSGSYTDLSNKPTIPSNNNQLTNGAGYITSSGSCSYSTTSGTSTYSTYLKSLGSQTPKSGRDIFHSGVYTYTTFTDTNTPAHYGAVIGYGNGQGGSCEMFAEWVGRGKLWFRVLRDYQDSWTDWQQIITSDNIGSQSVNYANSAGSVAWSNVSGKPTIPTNTNQLTNGAGYITSSDSCNYANSAGYVQGNNNSANAANALLRSGGGRSDSSPEGDTWIFLDELGGASAPWGFKHNQLVNTIGFYGAGTETSSINLSNGHFSGTVDWSHVVNRPTNVSNFTNDSGYITSSGSCNYANSADRANYLGDIGSTDRNSASGTGWYSVGFSYSYDEGHNELAINNYWGIRLNCRDTNHVTINGSKINCDSDTTLNGYKIYVG